MIWVNNCELIIQLVDSICRDRADTQYMMIQNNLKNGKLITTYRSSLSIFTTNNMPNDTKKHCESTEPESWQTDKMFFFFFFPSFTWACLKIILWLFHDDFPTKQQHFTELCTNPSLNLSQLWILRGTSNRSQNKCGFIGDDIFFICMHAHDILNKKLGLQI